MRRQLATTAVLTGIVAGSLAGTAGAARAADTCGSYASTCPSATVSGIDIVKPDGPTDVQGTSASRLPFTGGEIALMSIAGASAIGAGVIFVTTGRRRRSAAH